MSQADVDKVVQLLCHGEEPARIAEVEGYHLEVVATIDQLRRAGVLPAQLIN